MQVLKSWGEWAVYRAKDHNKIDLSGTLKPAYENNPLVDNIEDLSDQFGKCLRIQCANGYQVSVIAGYGTNGSLDGLCDVAIIRPDGELYTNFDGNILDECGSCQTPEDVARWIEKVSRM